MSLYPVEASFEVPSGKKIYFASDFHFGIPDATESRKREDRVCHWLDSIKDDAYQIYLLGDLFDSWMEYKKVVPKGYIRFLGKLAELSDAGIPITVFTGNHDLWMHGYFEEELGVKVYKSPKLFQFNQSSFLLAHGDGLSNKEVKYNILKSLLHNSFTQFLYRQLHPDVGLRLADYFSRLGPKHKYQDLHMKPLEQEYQWLYAQDVLQHQEIDYFIFGHRHIAFEQPLGKKSTFINLGDWISYNTYAIFDGEKASLAKY